MDVESLRSAVSTAVDPDPGIDDAPLVSLHSQGEGWDATLSYGEGRGQLYLHTEHRSATIEEALVALLAIVHRPKVQARAAKLRARLRAAWDPLAAK